MSQPGHPSINEHLHTIMIVDDDAMLRETMVEILDGYNTLQAANGQEALELFKQSGADLILADVTMPLMNGYELCESIRKLPNGRNVPVIIMTGQDDVEAIEQAFDSGATDFLAKPINWHIINHRIQYTLRASHAINEATRNARLLSEAQRIAKLGNWSWNPDEHAIHVSEGSHRIFGLPRTSPCIFHQMLISSIHADDKRNFDLAIANAKNGHPADLEFSITPPDGINRTILMHAELNRESSDTELFGTFQDISDRRKAEEEIKQLAYYDAITGLPNRTLFKEHLKVAIKQANRNGTKVAVMFLDLDNFKRINDSLGHEAGDQLLEEVSNRLTRSIRPSDLAGSERDDGHSLARLGGDEFTVMLSDISDIKHVGLIAERILASLNEPVMLAGNRVVVTSSIGISVFPEDGDCIDTLLKHADAAMYQVKYKGRNGVFFYDDDLRKQSQCRIQLEGELFKALEHDEMTLFYQPKVDSTSNKTVGFEALIRWIHPERGMVPPMDFISVAEDSGLIIPMGKWIIKTACLQHQAWCASGAEPVVISVNISSHQFTDHSLVASVQEILAETGMNPAYLEFEITESILMHDADAAMRVLNELRAMGLKISIDDFGTGYSSMSYLKHFPIDVLKIDRSFIMDIPEDEQDATITKAIISLAKALDLAVVAEGVETKAQLQFLRDCECDQIQGYLFSPPVPPEKAGKLLGHQFDEGEN